MTSMGRSPCDNCGAPVTDRFCASCGQRAAERIVSLRTLLREFLEDQLSLEARLPRTLHALLLRPGLLTADYREGRVARYVPPTRLYLVTGLVSMAVLLLVPGFALVLKALYPRRLYTEHVIFILHLHSAFFLLGIVPMLAGRVWVTLPVLLLMATYLFLALRRSYGRRSLATVPRFLAMLVMYPIAIGVVAVTVLAATVLTY
jgi:hypothetical protein